MTPPEHEIKYIEVADLKDADGLALDFDLVAISTFSAQSLEAYTLAARLSEAGVPVIMGGLHVTSVPDEARMYGASVLIGEGEPVWPDILRDAERGELKPVYDARSRQFDLADAPMPAYELLDIDKYNRITVQTSRGCPWKCAFCASSILLTDRYKQKPIKKVLAEVDKVCDIWPRPFLEFADDNGFVNRGYWRKLLPHLAKRRIRWFTETDLSVSEDDELLEMIHDAGCAEVLIGFESPTPDSLDGIELNANWKKKRYPQYKQAIAKIQSHGIRVNACFVLGLDGHTPAVFDAVEDFVNDATPYDVQITYQTPFPNTPLYRRLKHEGRLTHDGQWDRCTLFDINYQPQGMTAEELRAGFHSLTKRLYNDEATAYRQEGFKQQYRQGHEAKRTASINAA
jgi:radical SAM superfamily enzyme YgiQ (UPF0313 family)